MDYSKFLSDNFDAKDWINAAFKANRDSSSAEEYSNTLARKLQMFAQEMSTMIEETCQKVSTNMPRVIRDIEYVRQEALLLHDQMKMVKHDIQKVEQDTSESMQSLLELDRIKTRLELASGALQVADCWTTLSAEVKEALVTGDVDVISKKLIGMQESLTLLHSAPDYEEKAAELEELKNQLEQAASPTLVQCFISLDTEKAKSHVQVFSALGRLADVHSYYERCQRGPLEKAWVSLQSSATLPSALAQLYDLLLTTWHSQMRWCAQVFSRPVEVVSQLLCTSLSNLRPSLGVCIEEYLQTHTDSRPSALFQLKQITDHFSTTLESAVMDYGKDLVYDATVRQLVAQVFQPYMSYMDNYEQLESGFLMHELGSIPMNKAEIEDSISCISESVNKVFGLAKSVDNRCLKLTNGCGYIGLISSLKNFFSHYIKKVKQVISSIQESSKSQAFQVNEEDWTLFQQFLRIIQACGELLTNFEKLNTSLVSNITSSLSSPTDHDRDGRSLLSSERAGQVNPFHDHRSLLVSRRETKLALRGLSEGLKDQQNVLPTVHADLVRLCREAHRMTFDVVFTYIASHLRNVCEMPVWISMSTGSSLTSNLPAFSLSPQEYITKVGQYLLTLPQHLEPFTREDHPAVYVATKLGSLPYTNTNDEFEHMSDLWLESVTGGTMHLYADEILKINELSSHAARQLITDIEYLCNVGEDLGFHPTESLSQLVTLLKAAPEEFTTSSAGVPTKLSNAVRAMRNLM